MTTHAQFDFRFRSAQTTEPTFGSVYCITPIFRVEEIFAIFANLDFARNFPPAKIISTANGNSRNFPPAKINYNSGLSLYNVQQKISILQIPLVA